MSTLVESLHRLYIDNKVTKEYIENLSLTNEEKDYILKRTLQ